MVFAGPVRHYLMTECSKRKKLQTDNMIFHLRECFSFASVIGFSDSSAVAWQMSSLLEIPLEFQFQFQFWFQFLCFKFPLHKVSYYSTLQLIAYNVNTLHTILNNNK